MKEMLSSSPKMSVMYVVLVIPKLATCPMLCSDMQLVRQSHIWVLDKFMVDRMKVVRLLPPWIHHRGTTGQVTKVVKTIIPS